MLKEPRREAAEVAHHRDEQIREAMGLHLLAEPLVERLEAIGIVEIGGTCSQKSDAACPEMIE